MKYVLLLTLFPVLYVNSFSLENGLESFRKRVGEQIFANEASGRKDLLVFWNEKESFPSLGIGHFIWYPKGQQFDFTEQFPDLCRYLVKHGIKLPSWLTEDFSAPWQTREEFLADITRTNELRELLASTINEQINFILERTHHEWYSIISAMPEKDRERVKKYVDMLSSTPLGYYSLIDYMNFKGSGLNPKEQRNGEGWGLYQVLLDMPAEEVTQENIHKLFALSAAKMLTRLIANSGPDYKSFVFFKNWMTRVAGYGDPKTIKY